MRQAIFSTLVFIMIISIISCNDKISSSSTSTQVVNKTEIVGEGCDGCELMFVDKPLEINSIDTSAAWTEAGQRLVIKGYVYKADGNTPARDVILYYWQTDSRGYYSPTAEQNEKSKRHGHIRGWVKTDKDGKYFIYTIKPAPYPNDVLPAHIHIAVKETNVKNEYYIDDLVFADDKLLTEEYKSKLQNRGGSGMLYAVKDGNLLVVEHKLTLGLNIPNYR